MKEEIQIVQFIKSIMPHDIPKVIVDVGANENAIFSQEFINDDWNAILIEPQPLCSQKLTEAYPNACVISKAVSCSKCEKKLYLAKSGDTEVATLNTNNDPWLDDIRSDDFILVTCDTLTNILDAAHCPTNIGILKIDTESYDPQVVESLDWQKYQPMFVVTEEYYWEPENLRNKYYILEHNNYVLMGFVEYNSIWRKRSNDVLFSTYILKDFLTTHGIYPDNAGNLDYVGRSMI